MQPLDSSWRSGAAVTAWRTREGGGRSSHRIEMRSIALWPRSSERAEAGRRRGDRHRCRRFSVASRLALPIWRPMARTLSSEELIDLLLDWCRDYPIVSIEDPLAEDDHDGMRLFTKRAGEHVQIVGDDYLVTSSDRIAAAAASGACNAVLLKPNQVGTITETAAALAAARAAGWATIVSARSGETEDVTIVHLAVGWAAGQLKVGSCARSERTAKWNEGAPHRRGAWRRGVRSVAGSCGALDEVAGMKAVLQYRATPGFRRADLSAGSPSLRVEIVDETDRETFAREMQDAEVLLHVLEPVKADTIERAPRLRLIQKLGIGVDTIDLEAARRARVAVCNMPGTNTRAVAELALLLMLATLRRMVQLDAETRAGNGWSLIRGRARQPRRAWRPHGRLVGFGAVGKRLTPMLQGMGARVVYTDTARIAGAAATFVSLDELLPAADVVSLHVPLTTETAAMMNEKRLASMKAGAILVNTARGRLVDYDALHRALESGHLRGAGLDVFDVEPADPSHPVFQLPNVVVTPHVAWLTAETLSRSLGSSPRTAEDFARDSRSSTRSCNRLHCPSLDIELTDPSELVTINPLPDSRLVTGLLWIGETPASRAPRAVAIQCRDRAIQ